MELHVCSGQCVQCAPPEITVTQLSQETGLSVEAILMRIKRGLLPPGRKEGKARMLPAEEARQAVCDHARGKAVKLDKPRVDWADLI